MPEDIYNLFHFPKNGLITSLGVVRHNRDGTDEEKMEFLRAAVERDCLSCEKFPLPAKFSNLTFDAFFTLQRLGRQLEVFEEIFSKYGASATPLCCVTSIINGKPAIDAVSSHERLLFSKLQGHPKVGEGVMADYLEDYMTPAGFDLPRLLHDDHFCAIRLLFNSRHYVSCVKLIASFIDTVAYLEHGDVPGSFQSWLGKFADLKQLGVTPEQFWELRNSLLHMSNYDSRKVLSGRESRIGFFVGPRGTPPLNGINGTHFNLSDLIVILADALTSWISHINENPERFATFVQRYDRVVSDARVAKIETNPAS